MNRKIINQNSFKVDGTFESLYAAQSWLSEQGYSWGSSSAMKPTAVMKGDYYQYGLPHKMKNFTKEEEKKVHGIMFGDFRQGPVTVHIYE